MRTLGIDLSSMPKATAACLINWHDERAEVQPPILRCTDDKLDTLISQANAIGIDAPFGWPRAFVEAVACWQLSTWSSDIRKRLQFRETDLHVQREIGIWPLSVTSNFIALPAMRAMALLQRHGVTDRSGDGRFFEVYPAGSLHCWKMRSRGYKRIDEACAGFRQRILKESQKVLTNSEILSDERRSGLTRGTRALNWSLIESSLIDPTFQPVVAGNRQEANLLGAGSSCRRN